MQSKAYLVELHVREQCARLLYNQPSAAHKTYTECIACDFYVARVGDTSPDDRHNASRHGMWCMEEPELRDVAEAGHLEHIRGGVTCRTLRNSGDSEWVHRGQRGEAWVIRDEFHK